MSHTFFATVEAILYANARPILVEVDEKTMLIEHVGATDPETLSRLSLLTRGLISRGMNPMTAQQQALAILDRQVTVQSSMLAFSKIYFYSGLVLICALPLLLLFRTGRARGSMGPVH